MAEKESEQMAKTEAITCIPAPNNDARVRIFRRATSFGGPDSLIEHRASVEGPATPTPDDVLRLAVGLEDPANLIADLDHALTPR